MLANEGHESWDEVFRGSQVRAEILAGILGAEGIEAQVLIDSFQGLAFVGAETAGLYVPKDLAGKARELVAKTAR